MNNSEFELVYQKYAKQLFYFLLKLCGDYDMAEDLAQETFMRAYQSIDSFRGRLQTGRMALPDRKEFVLQPAAPG